VASIQIAALPMYDFTRLAAPGNALTWLKYRVVKLLPRAGGGLARALTTAGKQ
jgi:hypothetical protein